MTKTLVAMNCEPNRSMKNSVLVWMVLLVWWRCVLPSPIRDNCDPQLKLSVSVTNALHFEAKALLNNYTEIHQIESSSVPDDVPSATVTGFNFSEKLQDIYGKNKLFELHLSQVEKYQSELLFDQEPLVKIMSIVKKQLSFHFFCVREVLKCKYPLTPEPVPPTALPVNHKTDYRKKVYGWGVIYRLTEWSREVLNVLNDTSHTVTKTKLHNFNKLKWRAN